MPLSFSLPPKFQLTKPEHHMGSYNAWKTAIPPIYIGSCHPNNSLNVLNPFQSATSSSSSYSNRFRTVDRDHINLRMSSQKFYFSMQNRQSKRCRIQVHRVTRRMRSEEDGKDMLLKNLKLYIENMSILEENERLRKKASLLHQENLELMSEIQKKFPQLDRDSTTLDLLLLQKQKDQ